MKQVTWTLTAQEELEGIIHFIGVKGNRYLVAENLYYEIKNRVQHQLDRDLPGHSHPAAPSDWLYLQFKRWIIFYRSSDNGIEVMRIIDGARDFPNTL